MKLIAYILTFVVLFLSVTPCIDEHQDKTMQQNELSQGTSGTHENDLDHCSPFCTCQCCQTSFYIPFSLSSTTPFAIDFAHQELNSVFQSIELFEYFIPPKA